VPPPSGPPTQYAVVDLDWFVASALDPFHPESGGAVADGLSRKAPTASSTNPPPPPTVGRRSYSTTICSPGSWR
jgi:hypothetical protein